MCAVLMLGGTLGGASAKIFLRALAALTDPSSRQATKATHNILFSVPPKRCCLVKTSNLPARVSPHTSAMFQLNTISQAMQLRPLYQGSSTNSAFLPLLASSILRRSQEIQIHLLAPKSHTLFGNQLLDRLLALKMPPPLAGRLPRGRLGRYLASPRQQRGREDGALKKSWQLKASPWE